METRSALGRSATATFTVTRDGRWMAWSQIDRYDSDLMLVENFR